MDRETTRLLLIGSGHRHLALLDALRRRGAAWRDRLDVTLLSTSVEVLNTDMLPGLIAGHYRPSECHANLPLLARHAGVDLVQHDVTHFDIARHIAYAGGRSFPFGLAALDIDGVPDPAAIPGFFASTTDLLPLKPLAAFWPHWRSLLSRAEERDRSLHWIIVGSDAASAEIALAMAHRLSGAAARVKVSMLCEREFLPGYPRRVAQIMMRHMVDAGIALRAAAPITGVGPGKLFFADGSTAAGDTLIWSGGVALPEWLRSAGLATVDDGRVLTDGYARSISHPEVFVSGPTARRRIEAPSARSVQALHDGALLAHNLICTAAGRPLGRAPWRPAPASLLSTGARHGVACWYGMVWEGDWVWRWKDRADRAFLQRLVTPFARPVDSGESDVDRRTE